MKVGDTIFVHRSQDGIIKAQITQEMRPDAWIIAVGMKKSVALKVLCGNTYQEAETLYEAWKTLES